jgi:hypothetical protein
VQEPATLAAAESAPAGTSPVEPEPVELEPVEPEPVELEPVEQGPAAAQPELTEREREMLAFEQKWWKHAGSKEQAIRDTFDLSATRYYQLLNGLLDNPAALAHDPVVVGRLRRLRSTRARSRTGRPT